MMFKKIKLGIVGLLLVGVASCDKILEVHEPDNLVHGEFWQNKDQVYASLIGLYTSLNSNLNSFQVWGDTRSSLYSPGTGESFSNSYRQFLSHDLYPDNGLLSWESVYRSITWINSFIKNAPMALERDETLAASELQQMMGEAYALRALNYFYLVRAFKEVPIITEPYESDSQKFDTSVSAESDVLDFIEADLKLALEQAPQMFTEANNRYGRITKNAVRALWADVKLWRNQYQAVLDLCADLDAQYASSLVSPLEWYSIFNPGNSSESIFEYQYSQLGPSSPLYSWFAVFSAQAANGARYLANHRNIIVNSEELLYPSVTIEHTTSDTIRLANFSTYRRDALVSYGAGFGYEVYKFLGQAPYQSSYRPGNNRTANYIFYRYREILFMKAEAYAMLNRYTDAEDMINIIRRHCDIPLLEPGQSGEGTEFFTRLLMEREFELGFEGKEWFAAVRIGRRPGYENVLINKSATNNSMGRSYQVVRARLLDQESWFLPYHLREVENNPQLEQKEFYRNK